MLYNELIGHSNIVEQINNSIDSGMFSHAHLIVGEDGIGKSKLARYTALKILGKEKDMQYADIIEYRALKNKLSIGIRDVVDSIIVEINKRPYEGDKKVVIIHEAHKMTVDAQNSFLKTIEEPPKGVFIILICETLELILDTIKSRCQIHKLQRLSYDEMQRFLISKYGAMDSAQIKSIIAFSDGIPGRAERFIDDKDFKEMRNIILQLLLDIPKRNLLEFLKYSDFLLKYKGEWQELLTWLLSYIRDILIYKEIVDENLIINIDKIDKIKDIAAMFSFNKLNDIIDIVNGTRQKLERNVNPALVFDSMLIDLQDI